MKKSWLLLFAALTMGEMAYIEAAVIPLPGLSIAPQTPLQAIIVDSYNNTYQQIVYYDPSIAGVDLNLNWAGPNASIYFPELGLGYLWYNGYWVDETGYYWDQGRRVYIGYPAWNNYWTTYWRGHWNDEKYGRWHDHWGNRWHKDGKDDDRHDRDHDRRVDRIDQDRHDKNQRGWQQNWQERSNRTDIENKRGDFDRRTWKDGQEDNKQRGRGEASFSVGRRNMNIDGGTVDRSRDINRSDSDGRSNRSRDDSSNKGDRSGGRRR